MLYYTNHAHTILIPVRVLLQGVYYLTINVNDYTAVFWVLLLEFPSFYVANLLLAQCCSMLSAAAVYGN